MLKGYAGTIIDGRDFYAFVDEGIDEGCVKGTTLRSPCTSADFTIEILY
jgi:hypothetical protein